MGFVIPMPTSPLVVSSVAPQTMVVTLPALGMRLVTEHSGDIRREVTCDAVGLAPRAPGEIASWSHDSSVRAKDTAMAAHGPPLVLALDASPKSDESVRLEVTPPFDRAIDVLETTGTRARVRFEMGNAWAIGWLDRKEISSPFHYSGADFPQPMQPPEPRRVVPPGALRCDHAVSLEARVGGEARGIGTLAPRAPILVLSMDETGARVELPAADLVMAPEAELRVATKALDGCSK
jgi:hypothetical protein